MRKIRLPVLAIALIVSILASFCSNFVLPLQEAQAQAYVIGSDPIDGSTVNTLPSVVRIFFNAPISTLSTAYVYAIETNGTPDVGAASSHLSSKSSRELDIPIKSPASLPQGSYEVRWTAVANDDGHTTYGLIGFNLGVSSTGLAGTPELGPQTSNDLQDTQALNTISVLAIAWEWLARAALALWIGMLIIERFVLVGPEQTSSLVARIKRQTNSLQWLCLGTLLVGEIVTLILRSTNMAQGLNLASQIVNSSAFNLASLPQLLMRTNYGHLWLLRLVLIAVAMSLLYWISMQRHPQPAPELPQRVTTSGLSHRTGPVQRITLDHAAGIASITKEVKVVNLAPSVPSPRLQRLLSLWLLLAACIVLTQALSENAVFQLHISTIVFDWLYRIIQGAWFGGIAYLAYIVLPFLPKAELERRAETVALLFGRLVPYLLFCLGITLVSGLFFAEASLTSPTQLLHDPYGRSMLVQLVLIALALLLTLYIVFVLRPRFRHQALSLPVVNADLPARRTRQSALEQTWHGLKQVLSIQAWLGAGILLCSSFMSFYAPPIVYPNVNYVNPTATSASAPSTVQTKQVDGLSLSLQVLPGKVNVVNTVVLLITESSGTPITNANVTIESNMQAMAMGRTSKELKSGNPVYAATFAKNQAFDMAGAWLLNVTIQRPGHSSMKTTFVVNVS